MNAHIHATTHLAARDPFLSEFSYMLDTTDKFAADAGGADTLPPDKRRQYDSRKRRLAAIAAYYDAAEARIEAQEQWIADLVAEKRQLADQLRDIQGDDEPPLGHWRERHTRVRSDLIAWLRADALPLRALLAPSEAIRAASIARAERHLPTSTTPSTATTTESQALTPPSPSGEGTGVGLRQEATNTDHHHATI